MLNLLQGASDDQVALIGCLAALLSSAGLMYVSYFVGPAARKQNQNLDAEINVTKLPLPPSVDASRERAA